MTESIRILHLEDVPADAEIIQDKLMVEPIEFVFKTVDQKEDFVKELNDYNPDLVLSDYNLPDMNGRIAIKVVKETYPELPVIIVTGTLDEETAVDLMKAGAVDYVLKENLTRLFPAVQNALRMKRTRKEKEQAEQKMLMANERMQYLLFSTSAIIYSAKVAANYTFTFVSENVFQMTHFLSKEVIDVPDFWIEHIHPEDRQRVLEESKIIFEQGYVTHEYRFLREDNSYLWLRDEKKLTLDLNDEPLEIIGHIVSITDRKKAEQDLQKSEELYRSVVTSMAEGIIVQAADGSIQACNKRSEEILGLTREQMLGKTYVDPGWQAIHEDGTLFPGENHPAMVTLKTGKPSSNVIMGIHKPNCALTWISINSQPIFETSKIKPSAVVTSFNEVTKQKIAEQELKISEQKYREVIEGINDIVYRYKLTKNEMIGDIEYINYKVESILGYSLKEYKEEPKLWFKYIHPDDQQQIMNHYQNFLKEKKETIRVYRTKHKNHNTYIWLEDKLFPQLDDAGNIHTVFGIARDITDRIEAEKSLKNSEQRFRTIFNDAAIGMAIIDLKGHPVRVNPALEKMLGYSAVELGKMTFSDFTYKDDNDKDWKLFNKLISGKINSYFIEKRYIKKDGYVIWGSLAVSLIRDSDGKPLYAVGMVEDITRQKLAEEELKNSEAKYRSFFENDISGVYISTVEGEFIDCNPSFIQMLGFDSLEDVKTTNAYTVYSIPANRDKIIELVREYGKLTNYEVEFRRKDGNPLYVIQNVIGIFDGNDELQKLMGYVYDITERKQLEQQLFQSQKLEAIGQLAGGVAHDFNNLLTVINGYSDMMLNQTGIDDSNRKMLEQIKGSGKRAASLISQLLAFSRKQIIQPKIININSVVSDGEKMLKRLLGEDILIKTVLDTELGNVKVDPSQMDQVLINLAVNARDAMPKGGKLTIETKNEFLDDFYAKKHISVKPGNYVLLSVSDTGTGMDEKTRVKIFEPFFTTKEIGKGTGLGLSTVYGIVKRAEGNIWVYSEPGKGTTFKIYLPLTEKPIESIKKNATVDEKLKGEEKILVVEDDPEVCELTTTFLKQFGYNVFAAKDGKSAIKLAKSENEPFHLLVTDVIMPEMSGRSLSKRIKSINPDIKILFVSGYTGNALVHHGILDESVNFLPKPFSAAILTLKVREVLDF